MTERKNISPSPECSMWEALLADALDGLLKPEDEAAFAAHIAACPACAALFDEARRGREWLEFLSPEPEMPEGLLERILAQTGPGHELGRQPTMAGAAIPAAVMTPAWQRPGFMGQIRRWAEPRLMMTAAMAFFSIALTLNLTGVRLSEINLSKFSLSRISLSSLRPSAVRAYMERQLAMASVPIIRYYDHSRLANEVQSRMRELFQQGREMMPEQKPGESQQNHKPAQQQPEPSQVVGDGSVHFVEAALRPEGIEIERMKTWIA